MNVSELKVGDWVILRGAGLCQVTQVGGKDGESDETESGFELNSDGERGFVALSEAAERLRAPVSKEDGARLWELLKQEEPESSGRHPKWSFARPEVERILESVSLEEQIQYLKALLASSAAEKFVKDRATHELERIIFSELAFLLGRPAEALKQDWKPRLAPSPSNRPERNSDEPTVSTADRVKTIEDFGMQYLGMVHLDDAVIVGDVGAFGKEPEGSLHGRGPRSSFLVQIEAGEWHMFLSHHQEQRMLAEEFIICHRNSMENFTRIEDDSRAAGELKLRSDFLGVMPVAHRDDKDFIQQLSDAPQNVPLSDKAARILVAGGDGKSTLFVTSRNRKAVYVQVVF